jgi:hypothetical protein
LPAITKSGYKCAGPFTREQREVHIPDHSLVGEKVVDGVLVSRARKAKQKPPRFKH